MELEQKQLEITELVQPAAFDSTKLNFLQYFSKFLYFLFNLVLDYSFCHLMTFVMIISYHYF